MSVSGSASPIEGPIAILTGAGISRESGLHTFRDADGIWAQYDVDDVATPQAFARNPGLVQGFYNARRDGLLDPAIKPNAAHFALAELEAAWPHNVTIITQNIDDLHERAGSRSILHMHGELLKVQCTACQMVTSRIQPVHVDTVCEACGTPGTTRPYVVWFGEMPRFLDDIEDVLSACTLFVSIGTSGNVYPAAGLVSEVRRRGVAQTLELNLEPSSGATLFEDARYGPATEIVPEFVRELLNRGEA